MKKVKAHTRQTAPTNREIADMLDIPLWKFYDFLKDRKTRPAIINRDMTIEEMHVAINHYLEYGYKNIKAYTKVGKGKSYADVETEPEKIAKMSMEELESILVDLSIELGYVVQTIVNRIREARRTISMFKI